MLRKSILLKQVPFKDKALQYEETGADRHMNVNPYAHAGTLVVVSRGRTVETDSEVVA